MSNVCRLQHRALNKNPFIISFFFIVSLIYGITFYFFASVSMLFVLILFGYRRFRINSYHNKNVTNETFLNYLPTSLNYRHLVRTCVFAVLITFFKILYLYSTQNTIINILYSLLRSSSSCFHLFFSLYFLAFVNYVNKYLILCYLVLYRAK